MTGVQRRPCVAVVGAGECDGETAERALALGAALARAGCVVVTGGLGGVMEAASRGAAEAGGVVVALLPGADAGAANPWAHVVVATGCGEGRNVMLVNSAEALVAVGGGWGTLSEIALARKRGKPVVDLGSSFPEHAARHAATPEEAVRLALGQGASGGPAPGGSPG